MKINVDNHKEISQQYEIRSIPTVLYFKDGQVIERVNGVESVEKVVERVRKIAERSES